jgi:hypothetical protein
LSDLKEVGNKVPHSCHDITGRGSEDFASSR